MQPGVISAVPGKDCQPQFIGAEQKKQYKNSFFMQVQAERLDLEYMM